MALEKCAIRLAKKRSHEELLLKLKLETEAKEAAKERAAQHSKEAAQHAKETAQHAKDGHGQRNTPRTRSITRTRSRSLPT